jgi:DNA-directed RNA polymerase specialized sigma24 family protein
MPTASRSEQARRRHDFDDLYERHQRAVLAYALRRTASLSDAEDVAAETFFIAWRRHQDSPDEPLPWLYAIARRVVANQRRAGDRRARLLQRVRSQPQDVPTPFPTGTEGPALVALRRLRPDDQELLRLVAWEGLGHAEIAVVLGVSVNAVTIRLHRARRRFVEALERSTVKGSRKDRTSNLVQGRSSVGRREGMQ